VTNRISINTNDTLSHPGLDPNFSSISENSISSSSTYSTNDNASTSRVSSAYKRSSLFDRHQLTTFHDNNISSASSGRVGAMRPFNSAMDESKSHDISAFLARPHRLATVTIDNATGFIGSYNLNNFFSIASVANKIAGFRFVTCDFHVKIMVNANRFSYGRIIAAHTPFGSSLTFNRLVKTSETPLLTTFPYIDIDIGSNETGTIDVPFCDGYMWSSLTVNTFDYSQVDVRMLSPFVGTTGVENATVSIFAWVDNLQLSIPVAHGDVSEIDTKKNNVVRPAVEAVRDISGALVNVPIISELAQGVHWASSLTDKAMSLFGFSKPINANTNTFITNVPAKGFTNSEGVYDGVTLSLRPTNSITSSPIADLCSEDPMSFPYFFSRFQLTNSIVWNTTDLQDTILHNQRIGTMFDDANSYWYGLANGFALERGGILIRLSVVKNAFYSGRLSLEFATDGLTPFTFNANQSSIVWDVSENREIYIRIPYVAQTRYTPTAGNDFRGRFILRVINELRAEDTMPQSVPILMFACPNVDYSFACPSNYTIAFPHGLTDQDTHALTRAEVSQRAIPLLDVPLQDHNSEAIIIGEPLLSLRDLIKRHTFLLSSSFSSITLDPYYFDPSVYNNNSVHIMSSFFGFFRGTMRYMFVVTQPPTDASGNSPAEYLLRSFLTYTSAANSAPAFNSAPVYASVGGNCSLTHFTLNNLNRTHEVSVPYYCSIDRFPIGLSTYIGDILWPLLHLRVEYDTVTYVNPPTVEVYQSCGDDATFSFPRSCGNYS
jgi:hypothetical protein